MAVNHEAVKNRTCVPNWKGNVYSHSIGEHLNDEHMTDEKAISLLNKKLIPEDFFKKLPDGYKPASAKVDEEKSEVKRGRKPKTE